MAGDSQIQLERQLQILKALDHARDELSDDSDPMGMFQELANLIQKQFEADAAALTILKSDDQDIELVASAGVPNDMAISICQEAQSFIEPAPVSSSAWAYTLGLRILFEKTGQVMGGMFIGRKEQAFTLDDIKLLKLVESQIDSSIVQARTIWKLAHRNRELEAIYQIDRVSDDRPDEETLISSLTHILVEQFRAKLCLIMLKDSSNNIVVRSLVDKHNIDGQILDTIREAATDIQSPQILRTPAELGDFQLLAAPLIVSGERIGAMVVGRLEAYDISETRLIYAMTSQIDTAIAKNRMAQQLEQRRRELEAIYRIDHIRDQDSDFDTMMHEVLAELCKVISSETGYILLYNTDKENELELKASTKEAVLIQPEYLDVIKRVSREALTKESLVNSNKPEGVITSIIAVPLILNARVIGVFGAINSRNKHGFDENDLRMLSAITSQVDTAVFERLERRRMRQVLSRSVDPKVLDALLQRADDSLLAGERVVLSVLFADLRGSTEWAERTDPEELVMMLNTFLGMMTDIIFKHGGTLDKFVGDEVIALFGSPIEMEDHAYHAAQAALEMQEIHKSLQSTFEAQGKELPAMGVGVSSGEVIAGEFGPPIRTDFTAMGRVMNLGARLCSAAAGEQIIISQTTNQMLGDRVETNELAPVALKGIGTSVPMFELVKLIK